MAEDPCPECGAISGWVLCDGCKFETCRSCGYRCACDEYEYDVAPEHLDSGVVSR